MKIETIHPRDIIAVLVLIGCFILMYKGINGIVTAITISIIAYYFSKRIYEERHEEILLKTK